MKKIGLGILACIVLASIVSCGRRDDINVQNLSNTEGTSVEGVIDSTENYEYVRNHEEPLCSNDLSDYKILTTANSEAALKNLYYTVDDFIDSNSSDAIVKGNISEIEYVYIDGCSYSMLTVEVEETYRGEAEGTIAVYEDGGYTRLSDEKEQIEAHVDLSQYTEEEMDNLLVEHTFMGAKHSKVGDTVILFLKSNEGSILGDSYRINCSVFGRYTLNDDCYVRPEFLVENDNPDGISAYSNMDSFEVSVPKSILENKLSE